MRFTLPVLLTLACANPKRDLRQCEVLVAGAPGRLATCLVSQHDWDRDKAAHAEITYDDSMQTRIRRWQAESVWVAESLAVQYRRYMYGRNALLRACVARYALIYKRQGLTPRPHGDESPTDAMVRVCVARFPDADQYPLTPGFFDSLTIIAR